MLKETGISCCGFSSIESAAMDFKEIKSHNCTSVPLAFTESDLFFRKPQIPRIVDAAKKEGLIICLNTWGIGKSFGGEPPKVPTKQVKQWRHDEANSLLMEASGLPSRIIPVCRLPSVRFPPAAISMEACSGDLMIGTPAPVDELFRCSGQIGFHKRNYYGLCWSGH